MDNGVEGAECDGNLWTPGQVAAYWRVDPKTVSRWARAGRLQRAKTPGGHGRFWEADVKAFRPPVRGRRAKDAPETACSHKCEVHCRSAAAAA